jgi:hypothetical protein
MPALEEIRAATDQVAAAQTQLDELAAMIALDRLVTLHSRRLVAAALDAHKPAAVARALGVSRQAIAKRARARAA